MVFENKTEIDQNNYINYFEPLTEDSEVFTISEYLLTINKNGALLDFGDIITN